MLRWMRWWLGQHRGNSRSEGNPFARDTQPRKLRVLLHLSDGAGASLARSMVAGLESCDALDVWSTARDGIRRVYVRWNDRQSGEGSVFVLTRAEAENGAGTEVFDEMFGQGLPAGRHVRNVVPLRDFVQRERETWLGWMPDLAGGPLDELDEWLALHHFASVKGIDLVATDSTFILSLRPRGFAHEAVTLPEVVACTGLYRRSRGDFDWLRQKGASATHGRSGFYRMVSAALIPSVVQLLPVLPRPAGLGQAGPWHFAQAVLLRADHALRARDAVHWALLGDDAPGGLWSDNRYEGLSDALYSFEMLLVSLVGAFDEVAQLANVAYGLGLKGSAVSWRNTKPNHLMPLLQQRQAAVAAMMVPGQPARDVLEIVAELRNTIHGTPLGEVHYQDRDHGVEELVLEVPQPAGRRVAAAMQRLGSLPAFGARFLPADQPREGLLAVEPQGFVEGLLPRALHHLDRVVAALDISAIQIGEPHHSGASVARQKGTGRDAVPRMLLLAGLAAPGHPGTRGQGAARQSGGRG